jgi:Rrf2 family transcriptional regulator, iron-sulfur cluster assembly transcription factor
MRLTTKGRFAVTAMLDLALHANDGPVTLANISERQKISLSYLEQLFGKLRRNELVQSVRGPGGGYNLAKPAAQLNVADIIVAVEEQLDSRQCEGREPCMGEKRCMTHDLWESLNDTVLSFLAGVTLADLVQKQNSQKMQTITGPKSLLKVRPNNTSRGRAGVETPLSVS